MVSYDDLKKFTFKNWEFGKKSRVSRSVALSKQSRYF